MPELEIEAALDAVFKQCELFSCPLNEQQKQILLQAVQELAQDWLNGDGKTLLGADGFATSDIPSGNPLDELTPEERQTLLEFIRGEESENRPWKTTLLNDWVQERNSGAVQFIRDRYGLQWLERVKPFHLAQYANAEQEKAIRLKVGDRIEVTNGLWEWVQEEGPCSREWFLCKVISIREPSDEEGAEVEEGGDRYTSCVVRFDTGAEYEIQGVYDWNRPNWRWVSE
ncbi:MAG: hypothetical protein K6T90_18415 [Leptolyngbyaceae cyanobacterium HOT.MB2.61]|jgi:hypothetical protein|nr:hypothetical protein [Leptolyngbyaceae cyanobacterium HOT.MB2.61]